MDCDREPRRTRRRPSGSAGGHARHPVLPSSARRCRSEVAKCDVRRLAGVGRKRRANTEFLTRRLGRGDPLVAHDAREHSTGCTELTRKLPSTNHCDGPETIATSDWRVSASEPLLRRLSWLLKLAFSANHRWAMARGQEALALELRRRRRPGADPSKIPSLGCAWQGVPRSQRVTSSYVRGQGAGLAPLRAAVRTSASSQNLA